MGYKSDSGKGSLPRDRFDYDKYDKTYERLYHPQCKGCGTITRQRTGWLGKYYCVNRTCEYYKKIFRSK